MDMKKKYQELKYDIACQKKYQELTEKESPEPGYSRSELFSVMVVLGCSKGAAKTVIDRCGHNIDWSETDWAELRDSLLDAVVADMEEFADFGKYARLLRAIYKK